MKYRFGSIPLRAAAEAIIVGTAGGYALTVIGIPAGWLCGSAIAVALFALCGREIDVPSQLRDVIFIVLGTSMGSALTPQTLRDAQLWPMSIAILLVSVSATMILGTVYLRLIHKWDLATARLSSTPGALSAVLALATSTVANFPIVAFSQTLRQFVLISLIPVALLMGTKEIPQTVAHTATPIGMLIMLAAGILGSSIASAIRLPGGKLVGAMVASSILHLCGYVDGRLAPELLVVAYVLMGAVIGSRFRGTRIAVLRQAIIPALGSIFFAVIVSVGFAVLCGALLDIPFPEVWLAYAPGGVEAMTVMAYALNLNPSYVSAHHVIRLLALILLSPLWTSAIAKKEAPTR